MCGMYLLQPYYSWFPRIEDEVAILTLQEMCFFTFKYLASRRPAGPGINISKILLSISAIDYYSQKKVTFIITERQYVSFFCSLNLTILVRYV